MTTVSNLFTTILIAVPACLSTAERSHQSPWLPLRKGQVKTVDEFRADMIRSVTGHDKPIEFHWLDTLDTNGDLREDAIITIPFGEAHGARGWLNTETSYVILGKGEPHSMFQLSGSELWFSITTSYHDSQTKYPDTHITRQFSTHKENDKWLVDIHETLYTNNAGDSGNRGMHWVKAITSTIAVEELNDWKPKVDLHSSSKSN